MVYLHKKMLQKGLGSVVRMVFCFGGPVIAGCFRFNGVHGNGRPCHVSNFPPGQQIAPRLPSHDSDC